MSDDSKQTSKDLSLAEKSKILNSELQEIEKRTQQGFGFTECQVHSENQKNVSYRNDNKSADSQGTLPYAVLGKTMEGWLLEVKKPHRKVITVPYKNERQLLEPHFERIFEGKEFEAVTKRMRELAANKGLLTIEDFFGSGIYKFGSKWFIVSGSNFLEISSKNVTKLDSSFIDEKVFIGDKDWLDIDLFFHTWNSFKNHSDQESRSIEIISESYRSLESLLCQFNWKYEDCTPYVVSSVMATPMQHAMTKRPWMYLSGESNSGKTTFLTEVILGLFGNLVEKFEKATTHAIAQTIGNTSKILILDEFEKNPKNEEILENLKGSFYANGGTYASGSRSKKAHKYLFKTIPWFASITESADFLRDAAKKNRTIFFQLSKQQHTKELRILPEQEMRLLATKILIGLILNWGKIESLQRQFILTSKEKVDKAQGQLDGRTIESFSYLSAIHKIAKPDEKPLGIPIWAYSSQENDGDSLFRWLLNCKVRVGVKEALIKHLILIAAYIDDNSIFGEVAAQTASNLEMGKNAFVQAKTILENYGMKVGRLNKEKQSLGLRLIINCQNAHNHLCRKDRSNYYERIALRPLLDTLEGCIAHKARFSGSNTTHPAIPFSNKTLRDELGSLVDSGQETDFETDNVFPEKTCSSFKPSFSSMKVV